MINDEHPLHVTCEEKHLQAVDLGCYRHILKQTQTLHGTAIYAYIDPQLPTQTLPPTHRTLSPYRPRHSVAEQKSGSIVSKCLNLHCFFGQKQREVLLPLILPVFPPPAGASFASLLMQSWNTGGRPVWTSTTVESQISFPTGYRCAFQGTYTCREVVGSIVRSVLLISVLRFPYLLKK